MAIQFKKAQKYGAKGRVALIGPAGSGKSFSALRMARTLVGPTGRIAAIDTEHGSLSKYAHTPKCPADCKDPSHFDFDVFELDSYSPENFQAALDAAIEAKYDAFLADSLSHFWMGKDGALEFVDMAAKKSSSRDGMSGWKEFRPHERGMVDSMIAAPLHVVVTMRTKTDYAEVEDGKGKKKRVKIGLAPVQREGLEFEFDLVGLMTDTNDFIVDKSRCFDMNGKVYTKPGEKEFAIFRDWLSGDVAPEKPKQQAPLQQPQAHTNGNGNGNGHRAQNGQSPSGHRADLTPFHVDGCRAVCHSMNVEKRETKKEPKNPFRVVKMNGAIGTQYLVYCWHVSQFEALDVSVGKSLQFEFETDADNKYINILNVLAVGDQEYRDGKPYTEPVKPANGLFENEDAEPVAAGRISTQGAANSAEISDDDIPF
jgi:hypothetical protein